MKLIIAIFKDAGKDSIKTVYMWNQHHGGSGGWSDSGDAAGMVALVTGRAVSEQQRKRL